MSLYDFMGRTKSNVVGIELVLSILLSVSLAQGLNLVSSTGNDITWLGVSLFYMIITIGAIYLILKIDITDKIREFFRAATVSLFALFPFSIQRLNNPAQTWTVYHIFCHLLIIGLFMMIWGYREKEKKWNGLMWFAAVVMGGSLLLALLKFGGSL